MPFDSAPSKTLTQEEKIDRLLYHISQATDFEQGQYCSCLAHRCYTDPILIEAGLPKQFWGSGLPEVELRLIHEMDRRQIDLLRERRKQWADFFGFTVDESYFLFGGSSVANKKELAIKLKNRVKYESR